MSDWRTEANNLESEKEKLNEVYKTGQLDRFYKATKKVRIEIEKLMQEARGQGFEVSEAKEEYRFLSIYEDWQKWDCHHDLNIRSHFVITWTITDKQTNKFLMIDLGVINSYKNMQEAMKIFGGNGIKNPFSLNDVEASTDGSRVKEEILNWLNKIKN